MLRAVALTCAALTCALCTGSASAATDGGAPAAFVTLERSSQLVGVDLTTGRAIARIRVPAGPTEVAAYGARYLLVVSPRGGAVTLVDSFSERVLKIWRGFGRPTGVATNGAYAYVADAARSELVIIDLARREVRGRVAVRPAPQDVTVGDAVLVTHAGASPNLTVAELSWNRGRVRRFRHFSAAGAAEQISHQPDTGYVYVTYSGSGMVGALDWGAERLRWRRDVGRTVAAIAVDYYHGRRLWVADRGAGAVLGLSSYDGSVLERLGGCPGARGVAFVGTAWVVAACGDANMLAIWSQRNRTRKHVTLGGRPHGVAEVVLP